MGKIVVEEYNEEWVEWFQMLKCVYERYLGDLIYEVHHVGSTSVRGLAGKPVIDVDIVIDSRDKLPAVIDRLSGLGYEYVGDLGIKDREAFRAKDRYVPVSGSGDFWYRHNLYVCIKGSLSLRNHLEFRDYLRANYDTAKEYGDFKKKLADEDPYGADNYCQKKTPFIIEILKRAGFEKKHLDEIREQNKYMKRI